MVSEEGLCITVLVIIQYYYIIIIIIITIIIITITVFKTYIDISTSVRTNDFRLPDRKRSYHIL